jgi:hypothetical protein
VIILIFSPSNRKQQLSITSGASVLPGCLLAGSGLVEQTPLLPLLDRLLATATHQVLDGGHLVQRVLVVPARLSLLLPAQQLLNSSHPFCQRQVLGQQCTVLRVLRGWG